MFFSALLPMQGSQRKVRHNIFEPKKLTETQTDNDPVANHRIEPIIELLVAENVFFSCSAASTRAADQQHIFRNSAKERSASDLVDQRRRPVRKS